jgi:hypothetical protein
MASEKHTTSLPRPKRDLRGQSFGRLVAQRYLGGSRWECLCACGRVTSIESYSLTSHHTQSCGCTRHVHSISNSYNTIHGLSTHPIYQRWRSMLKRCYLRTDGNFPNYGGRGITVCERWRDSVTNFYADMGDPPPGMQLERRDNNQGYCPANCMWASPQQQARNRRSSHLLTYNGETHTIAAWAETGPLQRLRIPASLLYLRIYQGWSIERALTTPPRVTRKPQRKT